MKKYFLPSPHILVISLVISFVVGFIVTLQWKSGVPSNSLYPLDQLESQKELLQTFAEEQQQLSEQVSALRISLVEIQEKFPPVNEKDKQYREELKARIGLTEVLGPGVEIFLGDSPSVSRDRPETSIEGFVHASDLRDIVNLLFSSGAEAISINGRRILPLHAINVAGNTFLIDNFNTFPPCTITAAGSPDVILARLQDETFLDGLHRRSREKKLRFTSLKRPTVSIPPFSGSLHSEFLSKIP